MFSKTPNRYQKEAEAFVIIMKELASEVNLDYSNQSLSTLDSFISKKFEPAGSKYVGESLIIGMGCYVGEVIIRNIGGHWSNSGEPEVNEIGEIKAIYPIQKVAKRFKNGMVDSLAFYYATIQKHSVK